MRLSALIVVVTAGCAASDEPTLSAIEPARVTSLVSTPAVVRGANLAAAAAVDLDSETSAVLDRAWRLRVGTVELGDVRWRDREAIDIVVPRGLAAGSYDVTAISPAGLELRLPGALAVTDDPVGLALSIESAPGGAGGAVGASLAAGEALQAYAIVRDGSGAFVADVQVDWQLSDAIGTLAGAGNTATLTATTIGTAVLHAHHAGADLDADSQPIGVHAGTAARLQIVDANGTPIGDVTGLTTDSDGGLAARAVAYDAYDNLAGNMSVTWSVSGVTAGSIADAATASIDFTTPGTGVLTATHATLGSASTGSLSVAPGRAAALAIQPATLAISADAAPVTFAATATDADGNPTTNLGTLTWAVASGPITTLDPTTGALDPARAGSGTVTVASSHGPSATSGAITIVPGAPATITVSPAMLMTDADAAPTTFTADIADADGNAVAQSPAWFVASGGVGTLGTDGTLDPTTAGTGMIAATAGTAMGTASVTIAAGQAVVLTASPDTATLPEGGAPLAFSVTGVDQDANPTANLGALTWSVSTGALSGLDPSGMFTPQVPGSGRVRVTSSHGAFDDTGTISVLRRAALFPSLAASGPISTGGRALVTLTLTNTGELDAQDIVPCTLVTSSGLAIADGPSPAMVAQLAAGAGTTFTWHVDATAPGAQLVTGCASGLDAATSSAIASGNAQAAVSVATPAELSISLSLPLLVGRGSAFTISLDITNTGETAASSITPNLSFSGPAVTLVSAPSPGTLAAGASTTLSWTYRASATGMLQVTASAQGTDAASSVVVTSNTETASADVVESVAISTDPFGDGSAFGFVTSYRDRIVLGPNRTGTSVVSFTPDGVMSAPQTFLIARDAVGGTATNSSTPYRSLGVAGCVANTAACGPDNENGRGTLTGVALGGVEWLIAQSARDNKGSKYLYMTTDTDAVLDFRYVDLRVTTPGETFGSSALFALGDVLYLGQVGKTGTGPVLVYLAATPPAPGLEVATTQSGELEIDKIPGLDSLSTTHEKVDMLSAFNGLLYVASPGAWVRATVPVPRRYGLAPTDWTVITPSSWMYNARPSRATTKLVDLMPADRAVPQMASFGGRVFVGRNTTSGPQLWSCDPSWTGVTTQCDANDWTLIAPNTSGDQLLSQFDTNLTSISMVTATADYLYVGFDSPSGARVMRTSNPAATVQADFERDYGGIGLGNPANTRILDGKALTAGGTTAVWLTVAGSGALTLVMLP